MVQSREIVLPFVLERSSLAAARSVIEQAPKGTSITLDGSQIAHLETSGIQLLCALVLAAEGRGVVVTWTRVPELLVARVSRLGIGEVIHLADAAPSARPL